LRHVWPEGRHDFWWQINAKPALVDPNCYPRNKRS
jgi:hypothetical protein